MQHRARIGLDAVVPGITSGRPCVQLVATAYTPGIPGNDLGFRVGFQYDNKAPVDLNQTAPLVVVENQPVGTIVGEFNATDPEGVITYHLVSGVGDDNNSLFTIDANGSLTTAAVLDHEAGGDLSIRVQASDENNDSVEQSFTISLTDWFDNPWEKITASDNAPSDYFGFSVSQSGNILAVGAYAADPDGKSDAGAVYLYQVESNASASYLTKLTAPDGAAMINLDDPFPSRAIFLPSGHTMPIRGTNNAGAAYLYQLEANGSATYLTKVTAPDGAANDYFGRSVSQSGNILVVGAYSADLGGATDAGAAYLYQLEDNGSLTFLTKLTAPDAAAYGSIWISVSQSGNILAVGAAGADPGGLSNAGAAYLYQLEANGTVTYLTKVVAPDGAAEDVFGISVSRSGNILAVGAYYADPGGLSDAGAAYLYQWKPMDPHLPD